MRGARIPPRICYLQLQEPHAGAPHALSDLLNCRWERMKGRWRMDDETTRDGSRGSQETRKGIERMELLKDRFDAAEINRLITRQTRYRERIDALDLPADLNRLRFARWLVENGKLTEDADEEMDESVDSEPDASRGASADEPGCAPNANAALKYMPAPYWYARPRLKHSPNDRRDGWRRSLANVLSRLRRHREIARFSVNAQRESAPSKLGG